MPDQIVENHWWLKAVYQFGIPSAIAVFLVYALVTRVDRQIAEMQSDLKGQRLDTGYVIKSISETRQILMRICINTADTRDERRACVDAD